MVMKEIEDYTMAVGRRFYPGTKSILLTDSCHREWAQRVKPSDSLIAKEE